MPIGEPNFAAQSHRELYDRIQGSGGGYSQAVDDAWNNFRAVMGNAKAEVESAIRDAGAVWEGAAGESMGGGIAPLVQWVEGARVAGVETHGAAQAQQSYYSGTRTAVPEPVAVSSTANDDYLGVPAKMTHLVGGQTDQDVEEARANEAKREAVRVMDNYRRDASSAVAEIGTFAPPPMTTVEVADPKVEQSQAQQQYLAQQYSAQFADRSGLDTTADQSAPTTPGQSQVVPPPVVTSPVGSADGTHVSDARPSADVRPAPLPPSPATPMPVSAPQAQVPIGGLVAGRAIADRLGGGGAAAKGGSGFSGGRGTPNGSLPGHASGQVTGKGPVSGVAAPGGEPGRPSAATTGAKGAVGTPAAGGMGAGGQRPAGAEDKEHRRAAYLEEYRDVWDEGPPVAPAVIGDDKQ